MDHTTTTTYIGTTEALEHLGIKRKQLAKLIEDGEIEARDIRSLSISWESVIAYLERTAAR
jgi:hypothetical protein